MPDSHATPLEITVEPAGDAVTVRADGEIDIENCQRFGDALTAAAAAHSTVHVDLGTVGYMDSSGLRSLLAAKATAEAGGGSLDVIAASTIVTRLLDITGLTGMLVPPGA